MACTASPAKITREARQARQSRLSFFASVKLTVGLLLAIATTVLLGAWCPQSSQVGVEKVSEMFGPWLAERLIFLGVADIFHSPFFLALIGALTVNMIACSLQRVFPKVRSLKLSLPFLGSKEISRLPVCLRLSASCDGELILQSLSRRLSRLGFRVSRKGQALTAESGKVGRLAPTVTHIGLLTLLAGVTITSWTGFSGFQGVRLNETLSFASSEHSKLWLGKLPLWRVRVDNTRREDYASGEVKQWYSTLSVIDRQGNVLKKEEISVNNPLSFEGVDVYQSSWGLDSLVVSFNGHKNELPLRQMGAVHAAFLPLAENMILIFSVRSQSQPLRVFARTPEWSSPRLLCQLKRGQPVKLGSLDVCYEKLIPVTGLQYKSDPGLPVTYIAFAFITAGVLLAAIPHRQLFACFAASGDEGGVLTFGGVSRKAKTSFERALGKIADGLCQEVGAVQLAGAVASDPGDLVKRGTTPSCGVTLKEEDNVRSSACLN